MQIEERALGEVMILDVTGKLTIGDGDELLKDKINSLIQQGRKKLILNLEGVPYVDSAGAWRNREDLHDREPAGW